MVSVDVSKAFDSIDISRLLGIVEPAIRSESYTMIRSAYSTIPCQIPFTPSHPVFQVVSHPRYQFPLPPQVLRGDTSPWPHTHQGQAPESCYSRSRKELLWVPRLGRCGGSGEQERRVHRSGVDFICVWGGEQDSVMWKGMSDVFSG